MCYDQLDYMVGRILCNCVLESEMAVLKELIRITHHEDYSVLIWYAVWIVLIISLLCL